MKIGQQIRKQRERLGMSAQVAATKAGLSIAQWYQIERDEVPNPGLRTIEKMKKVVGMK